MTNVTIPYVHQLYYAAKEADDAYHAALVAEYGPVKAIEKRYIAGGYIKGEQVTPAIFALRLTKIKADSEYLNECRRLREQA